MSGMICCAANAVATARPPVIHAERPTPAIRAAFAAPASSMREVAALVALITFMAASRPLMTLARIEIPLVTAQTPPRVSRTSFHWMANSATFVVTSMRVDAMEPIFSALSRITCATLLMAEARSWLFATASSMVFFTSSRAPPRVFTLSAARPWVALVCSRNTWYLTWAFSRSVRSFHAFPWMLWASFHALT